MVAGAIGVGVAYPLDTVKVKIQAAAARRGPEADDGASMGFIGLVSDLVREDGVGVLYSGVSSTMLGQAAIKGVAFFAYQSARDALGGDEAIDLGGSVLAACFSGGAAALVCTPVERVKVVMQASSADAYSSPLECVQTLVREDGVKGIFSRGLGATLAREIPSYGLYFVSYELASDATAQQAEVDGGRRESMSRVAQRLYADAGLGVFWDGLTPKLLRAVVNHAVTFAVFEELNTALLQ